MTHFVSQFSFHFFAKLYLMLLTQIERALVNGPCNNVVEVITVDLRMSSLRRQQLLTILLKWLN